MLTLENIKYRYPNSTQEFELDLRALSFSPSLITCILGRNGCGKTTILNLIGGHISPRQGKILLDETDLTTLSANKRPTATVFQQIGLFPHLSIQENIEMAIEPNSIFRRSQATKSHAENILEQFNLTKYRKAKPAQLSVGQQQRVAIARAISTKPKILLLDEPTSALDFFYISKLKGLLAELKESNSVPTMIVVSHDLQFVVDIADEIKFIEAGSCVFEGSSTNFKQTKYFIR
jgi:ABC-type Fe3+/spermidine/putrescine transport system ATPase subunit